MKTSARTDSAVSNLGLKVWASIFLFAILAGLALQLLVLPYLFPQLHAGNGLLAGRDWVGFHAQAVTEAQKILQGGWTQFRLRPDGDNAIVGITGAFYALFGPHPWVLLPLSALFFATGGLALFLLLKQMGLRDREALIALLPYLFFPSSLLQYGQIHKDVFCTGSVFVILWAWVGLLLPTRKDWQLIPLIAVSAFSLLLLAIFRPYFMYPFLGLGILLLCCYLVRTLWQLRTFPARAASLRRSNLQSNLKTLIALLLLNVCVYVGSVTYLDLEFVPFPTDSRSAKWVLPKFSLLSNKDVRSADALRIQLADDAGVKALAACRSGIIWREDAVIENGINRLFLKIAVARAGFTSSGGNTVASNIDAAINFCRNEDLIRYVPRAMQVGLFAPFPSKWLDFERRNSSRFEILVSATEMMICYIAFFGWFYWIFSYERWTVSLLLPLAFAVGMTLLLGLTVANVGTLYRMRFPFTMIFISAGLAGWLRMANRKSWIELTRNRSGSGSRGA